MTIRKASLEELAEINSIIELCVDGRPVTDRIKKLTLPSLRLEPTDFKFMEVWVSGIPISGVLGLQEIKEGTLLHSLYVDLEAGRKGIGSALVKKAIQSTRKTNQHRLLVKAFAESVSFFEKAGFTPSDVLDYPYTLEMSLKASVPPLAESSAFSALSIKLEMG